MSMFETETPLSAETSAGTYVYGTQAAGLEAVNEIFRKVYQYMALGLIITAITAYVTASSPAAIRFLFSSSTPLIVIAVAEIALVLILSMTISKLSTGTALLMFTGYSVLNGLTFSAILLVYTAASVYQAFFTTAGMFAAMSIYGLYTKRDLTSFGSFLHMGLWGLIIAMLINFFVGSSMIEFVTSILGVIIFLGLTAFDTAKIKTLAGEYDFDADGNVTGRIAVIGALELYLDFINLFLYILKFMGKRKD